jgi:hypothetical protein
MIDPVKKLPVVHWTSGGVSSVFSRSVVVCVNSRSVAGQHSVTGDAVCSTKWCEVGNMEVCGTAGFQSPNSLPMRSEKARCGLGMHG